MKWLRRIRNLWHENDLFPVVIVLMFLAVFVAGALSSCLSDEERKERMRNYQEKLRGNLTYYIDYENKLCFARHPPHEGLAHFPCPPSLLRAEKSK